MFGDDDNDMDRLAKYNRLPDEPPKEIVHEMSDHEYKFGLEEGSSSTARRQDFKLTLNDFEAIAQRYEATLKILPHINDALDTKENLQ